MHNKLRTKILAVFSTVIVALGMATFSATSASAHVPEVSATCSTLHVNLSVYSAVETNTVTVTVDGSPVDSSLDFGPVFANDYDFTDETIVHTWQVDYVAGDYPDPVDGYTGSQSGITTPCAPPDDQKDATVSVSITDPTCSSAACAPPPCLPDSAVSYTYDATSNSGVITTTGMDNYSSTLCHPFWVTAASWTFDGNSKWPQTLDEWNPANEGNAIDSVGSYEYGAGLHCGQGDIYATFDSPGVPYPTDEILTESHTPYDEHFLHEMGFEGPPYPTYTVQDRECTLRTIEVNPDVTFTDVCGIADDGVNGAVNTDEYTFATIDDRDAYGVGTVTVTATAVLGYVFADGVTTSWSHDFTNELCPTVTKLVKPDATGPTCPRERDATSGYITLDLEEGIHYSIDGVPTSAAKNPEEPGTHTVSVSVDTGYILEGPASWDLEVEKPKCPDLVLLATTASMKNLTCSSSGSYTLPNTDGVEWFVNHSVLPTQPGTYTVSYGKTVDVDARLTDTVHDGWVNGATTEWEFNFAKSGGTCPQVTLAYTGSNGGSAGLLLAGGFLLIGGAIIAFERRFRHNVK